LSVIRTGTDNVAYTQTVEAITPQNAAPAQPDAGTSRPGMSGNDMANVNVPSVWRTNRTQAAAKVDALSSGGMDNYEIPAFLRKQAD
jgi:cell division protein FtsZ